MQGKEAVLLLKMSTHLMGCRRSIVREVPIEHCKNRSAYVSSPGRTSSSQINRRVQPFPTWKFYSSLWLLDENFSAIAYYDISFDFNSSREERGIINYKSYILSNLSYCPARSCISIGISGPPPYHHGCHQRTSRRPKRNVHPSPIGGFFLTLRKRATRVRRCFC